MEEVLNVVDLSAIKEIHTHNVPYPELPNILETRIGSFTVVNDQFYFISKDTFKCDSGSFVRPASKSDPLHYLRECFSFLTLDMLLKLNGSNLEALYPSPFIFSLKSNGHKGYAVASQDTEEKNSNHEICVFDETGIERRIEVPIGIIAWHAIGCDSNVFAFGDLFVDGNHEYAPGKFMREPVATVFVIQNGKFVPIYSPEQNPNSSYRPEVKDVASHGNSLYFICDSKIYAASFSAAQMPDNALDINLLFNGDQPAVKYFPKGLTVMEDTVYALFEKLEPSNCEVNPFFGNIVWDRNQCTISRGILRINQEEKSELIFDIGQGCSRPPLLESTRSSLGGHLTNLESGSELLFMRYDRNKIISIQPSVFDTSDDIMLLSAQEN